MSTYVKLNLVDGDPVTENVLGYVEDGILSNSQRLESLIASGSGTITTSGWVANSGDYSLKLDLPVPGITGQDHVDVFIDNNDLDVAVDSKLSPNNDSYDGGITFYSKSIPATVITFTYRRLR